MLRVTKSRLILFVLICLVFAGGYRYLQPLPLVKATATETSLPQRVQNVELPWPGYGHSAVGAIGYGLLNSSNQARPAPMASTAKVMTALAVLDKKPLKVGQQGPLITITNEDVAALKQAQSRGESVLVVNAGEQLSENEALQALLIPSANNVAAILANWAFGSTDNYLSYVNQKAKSLGMKNTNFADASGFSPDTTSTANDLIMLGLVAMKDPIISSIVNQTEADLPIAGKVKNVNWLLGNEGIVGIKTGNSDQAGGCFLLAAKRTIGGQPITILTAVMSAPDLTSAMTEAKSLLLASDKGFAVTIDNFSGTYNAKWGARAAISQKNTSVLTWNGAPTKITASLRDLPAGAKKGTPAGTVTIKNGAFSKSESVFLSEDIKTPSVFWRIFHR